MNGNTKNKARQSNFEILRLLAMFFIVVFHYAYKGGWSFEKGTLSLFCLNFFLILGELGVNLFMLITGYFMADRLSKNRTSHILLIIFQSVFYTLLLSLILYFNNQYSFNSVSSFAKILFPEIFNTYWYVTAYILIYLLSPYINKLLNSMDKKEFQKFLLLVLTIWCVIPTVFQLKFVTSETILF